MVCAIRSQGGVKVPTGGDSHKGKARERLQLLRVSGSSRSGVNPEPTVTVRMGEAKTVLCLVILMYPNRLLCHVGMLSVLLYALILVK